MAKQQTPPKKTGAKAASKVRPQGDPSAIDSAPVEPTPTASAPVEPGPIEPVSIESAAIASATVGQSQGEPSAIESVPNGAVPGPADAAPTVAGQAAAGSAVAVPAPPEGRPEAQGAPSDPSPRHASEPVATAPEPLPGVPAPQTPAVAGLATDGAGRTNGAERAGKRATRARTDRAPSPDRTPGAAPTVRAAGPRDLPPVAAEPTAQPDDGAPAPQGESQGSAARVMAGLSRRSAPPPATGEDRPESGYDPEPDPHTAPPPADRGPRPSLFIVHIAPEMAPVAKVGGLADVVFGIAREHAIRGNHVEIVLPKYDNLRYDQIYELHEVYRDLWVPWYEGAIHCTVFFGFVHSRKCFFIEPHSQDSFFDRGKIYGFWDDVMRFAFFSRAAMEFLWKAGKHPDIIHCHDWQTALVPVLLYEIYQGLGMTHPRACLTIHNFQHQGTTGAELLRATGLHRPERFFDPLRMADNFHKGAINLLKSGIVYSNFVTTVSPRYAFETKDQGQGFGLESTLYVHHMKYGGVLNGIDYDVWNPEVDTSIPVRFGADNLAGKQENKGALRQRLMLAENEKPVVAFIGRLDPQKGLELVRHAIFYALERGAQFVLLGSSPDPAINHDFWGLKQMLNDSPDCHLEIGFDEDLAHLIYAGSDIMLVPSQFEPCGLTQLIAMRYGTVPVVRTVGGLADTVFDKDHSDRPPEQRNGYRFDHYDGPGLESALGRAIDCYYHNPDQFRELMRNGMRADFSWNHPGQDYLNIYDFIRAR